MVGRTSSFQFRGKGHDLRKIGEELSVGTVLEGSVRKVGNRLRINAQLINADDGYHLWSERFDRTMDDVFAVQDDIAQSVVEKLKVKLLRGQSEPLVKPQVDPEAYQSLLRGRHSLLRGTSDGFALALRHFEAALSVRPDYAEALAEMAYVYVWQAAVGELPPKELCSAPGFLDSGLTVFASMLPRPARRSHVAPERGFDSGTSLASTARCTSA